MHQYNVGATFERIAINAAQPFPQSNQGNWYLLIAMNYCMKWPEANAIPNQEASTVTEALVTNFFCHFRVPKELHSDRGCKFKSRLIQETLQCLGVSKTHTTPLHPQSASMVECYNKMVEKHLWKINESHQRDWDARLPIFLLAYRASTHRLPCDLLFGAPPNKEWPTVDHAINLVGHLQDIYNFARQHLKLASDQMKSCYDRLTNCAGYHKCDRVWLHRPTRTKGKLPKLQSSWKGPYKIVIWKNDVVHRIRWNPRLLVVVHLDQLTPYQGTAEADGV
jgi:hypothetical protein